MESIRFEWDPRKAASNREKHGVSFEEARDSFFDPFGDRFWDTEHSNEEDRFLWLARSPLKRILLVVHCFRASDSLLRIISARKATTKEKAFYRGKS
jgi:hypothetical protein